MAELPSARRPDGTQPDLPQMPATPARPATSAQPPRTPPPPTMAKGRPAETRRTEPEVGVNAVLKEKMRVMFGIREDDPVFAMMEVLGEFERGIYRANQSFSAGIQEKLEVLNKNFTSYKEAMTDAQESLESVQQLNATLLDVQTDIRMLSDHVETVKRLSEQITQTGYMDRMIKVMTPVIAALCGVVSGFVLAAIVLLLKK